MHFNYCRVEWEIFTFEVMVFVGCVNEMEPKGMRQLGRSYY
jgi:hypothetical protein